MDTTSKLHGARRRALMCGLLALAVNSQVRLASAASTPVQVWKDPNCGCCKKWIAHLEANGFVVTARDEGNNAARTRLGMPARFGSCHTALVDGYVVEGHVPASDIRRLLIDRPAALGLAVPGMPIGSPGMDDPIYGGRRDPYQVLLIRRDGSAHVFTKYEKGNT